MTLEASILYPSLVLVGLVVGVFVGPAVRLFLVSAFTSTKEELKKVYEAKHTAIMNEVDTLRADWKNTETQYTNIMANLKKDATQVKAAYEEELAKLKIEAEAAKAEAAKAVAELEHITNFLRKANVVVPPATPTAPEIIGQTTLGNPNPNPATTSAGSVLVSS